MIDFLTIARRNLKPLTETGFTLTDVEHCRGEARMDCDRGNTQIRISYEPFGPPWCDLYKSGKFQSRLNVDSKFTVSKPLATTTLLQQFPPEPLQKHECEIEAWCEELLKVLEKEKVLAI